MFNKVELSVSPYDTAWVAMVPSPNSMKDPFFPQCVKWVMDNQFHDGSWGASVCHGHPLLIKDALLSTLACVLALKQWGIGELQINRGLHFIESNLASATDEKQQTPIGFDIIFPTMLEYTQNLNINLSHEGISSLDTLIQKRESELQRADRDNSEGWRAYLAYISEGLGKLQEWDRAIKYQRKNGSLFNSPSTTAAAYSHLKDADCLNYLHSVLDKFGNSVPTIFPLDIYARLCMVDSLGKLGVDRYFHHEIISVLDETYRFWLQGEEDIFSNAFTCAMAFRLLRVNGYDVFSDPLTQFSEESRFFNSLEVYAKDIGTVVELFRASEVIIHPDESVLEKLNLLTRQFLKQELSNNSIQANISQEVSDALNFPYRASLERLSSKRAIEHYNKDSARILKTSYSCVNIGNEDFLKLAVEDFNLCQSILREEFKHLERWAVKNRLDKLKFSRQKLAYCYFSAAGTLFLPELSDARMSWAKHSMLSIVIDDFYDVGGSQEEMENLTQLVEKWDDIVSIKCCSQPVEIIYSSVHNTVSELAAKALTRQGRCVTDHIVEIWKNYFKSIVKEAEWTRDKSTPTLDEYIENAHISSAVGLIVLPTLYFVGPKLSEEIARSCEVYDLFRLVSTCGRLLNDIQTVKRETEQGKLNAVSLGVIHSNNNSSEEEVIKEMESLIEKKNRELLKLVLEEEGSKVPKACKDLFWKMSQVLHLFYAENDGLTLNDLLNDANAVIH
ncbi:hypothetical protein FNV43_RR11428 [Rhamnella rubrinervis]|uniref:ent-kaurene synthase n=1 Tax=Rhamnella rubrinervis TaxID=2594499 RepID=A0A8K0H642_9ROSA|nr:hypothetical protein FNV43_RR11428 [Rhamnella rubrinervis]